MGGTELGVAYLSLSASTGTLARDVRRELGGVESDVARTGDRGGKRLGSGLMKGVGALKLGVIGVGATLVGLAAKGGITRALAIEGAEAKLTGLGHSATSVTKIMSNALDSVKGTAFGLGDAATVAASLSASGIKEGSQLTGVLKTVADTATISGRSLTDIGAIFGSVAARGKLQGDDMLQLMSSGVPVLQFLSKQTGKTTADVSTMVSKGQIDFATFAAAMQAGLGGSALASGKTFKGALSNVYAALGRLGAAAATPALGMLKGVFNDATPAIDALTARITPLVTTIAGRLAPVIDTVSKSVFGFITNLANGGGAGGAAGSMFSDLLAVLNPVGAVVKGMLPALGSLGTTLGQIGGVVGSALASVLPAVAQAFTAIGTALGGALAAVLPSLTPLFQTLGSVVAQLAPTLSQVATVLAGTLGQAFGVLGSNVATLLTALTPLLPIVGQLVASLLPPLATVISSVVSAIVPLGQSLAGLASALLPVLAQVVMTVVQAFTPLLPVLANLVGTLLPPLAQVVMTVVQAFMPLLPIVGQLVASLLPPLTAIVGVVVQAIGPLVQVALALIQALMPLISALLPPIIQLIGALVPPVVQVVAALGGALGPVLKLLSTVILALLPVVTALIKVVAAVLPPVAKVAGVILTVLVKAITVLITWVTKVVASVATFVASAIGNIGRFGSAVASGIGNVIDWFKRLPGMIGSALSGAASWLLSTGARIISGLKTGLANGWTTAMSWFGSLGAKVIGAFSGAASWLVSAGANIINGLKNGILSVAGNIGSWIVDKIPGPLKGAVKKALGIHSPSRVFHGYGVYIVQGLKNGITSSASSAVDAIKKLADRISTTQENAVKKESDRLISARRKANAAIDADNKAAAKKRDKALAAADKISNAKQRAAAKRAAQATYKASKKDKLPTLTRADADKIAKKNVATSAAAAKRANAILANQEKSSKGLWSGKNAGRVASGQFAGLRKGTATLLTDLTSSGKWNSKASKAVKNDTTLTDIAKAREDVAARLSAANAKLKAQQDQYNQLKSSVASSITGELDLSKGIGQDTQDAAGNTIAGKTTFASVAGVLHNLATKAKAFASKLKQLVQKGIPAGLVQEVAGLGTDEGTKVADALLTGTKAQVKSLSSDYSTLVGAGNQAGTILADQMYGAGINAQKGLINGLKANDSEIDKAAQTLANRVTTKVKKALGIKSPSRVFRDEVGKYLPLGVVDGIDKTQPTLDKRVAGLVDPSLGGKSLSRMGPIPVGDSGPVIHVTSNADSALAHRYAQDVADAQVRKLRDTINATGLRRNR